MLNELDEMLKWGVAAFTTLVLLAITNFFMRKFVLTSIQKTKAQWDDLLYWPTKKRLTIFLVVVCLHFSLIWIYGQDDEFLQSLMPYISSTYIILAASLASVGLKVILPAILDRYANPSTVKVSGSNSLLVFVSRATVWGLGIYFVSNELGLELFGIVASLAVFSLIIGLAMQQTLGNIVNSFMLALDQPFEVGDRVQVDGHIGAIASVGILSTKILTREENLVVIPNNNLVNSTIINHARGGGDGKGRRISLVLDVGVEYDEDIDHVKFTLLELMRACPLLLKSPEPRVLLNDLGEYAKIMRMYGWVEDYSDEFIARDWLLQNVDQYFEREGIGIAFPTSVELSEPKAPDVNSQAKMARIRIARMKMAKENREMLAEREAAKEDLDYIVNRLLVQDISKKERKYLQDAQDELQRVLTQFDVSAD
jgi:small-conductance mechanosensitive channel